jgi:hypothetical protein
MVLPTVFSDGIPPAAIKEFFKALFRIERKVYNYGINEICRICIG